MTRLLIATTTGLHDADGPAGLEGRPVVAAVAGGGSVWALDRDGAILRADDGAWEEAASLSDPQPRCLLPHDGGVLIGTALARLFRLRRDALEPVEAFDEVPGRDGWYTPWGGPPDTRSLASDAAGTVFANIHVGGIVRSAPDGSWQPTIDVDADVHQAIAHPERTGVVLAATAYGLGRSDDGGDTWELSDDGLHASYCRAVAVAGDTVLVTASTGPSTRRAALYRRPLDGDAPFEKCEAGLPEWFASNLDSHCLGADGPRAALGTAEGDVWRSDDAGRTWERAAEGLSRVTAVLWLA